MSKLQKQTVNFTQVSNIVLADAKLTWQARGLFAYLYSKPERWEFSAERIAKDGPCNEKLIRKILKELENAGYLRRHRLGTGKVEYDLVFDPTGQNVRVDTHPTGQNSRRTNRPADETSGVSNTEIKSNTELNPPAAGPAGGEGDDVSDVINPLLALFEGVNPNYDRLYRMKPQRDALGRLSKKYGIEKVENMLRELPHIVTQPYAPKITTPVQLEKDLGKLVLFVKQKAGAKGKEIIGLDEMAKV